MGLDLLTLISKKYRIIKDGGLQLNIDKNTNIYTSGLTNLPSNLLIGTIDTCSIKDNNTICNITLNPIDTNYCLILTEYTI